MHGYWERDPPVTTDQKDVLATVYIKDGKTLVAIGSWNDKPVNAKLKIDWERLGLEPSGVIITAPEIKSYQRERTFKAGEPIPVDALGDCILIISEK
jgi:hypothetical protein